MNKFKDIIAENKVLEIPFAISNSNDYSSIIKKAFAMTDGLLNLDNSVIDEDSKHIKLKITSKNVQTNFKVNKLNNNQVDIKNLIRGLNKALTDIFYLGNERFYLIDGEIIQQGIAFISNKQKRTLLKEGLIGTIKNGSDINKSKDSIPKQSNVNLTNNKPVETITNKENKLKKELTQAKNKEFKIPKHLKYLEDKNDFHIYKIIQNPEKNTPNTVKAAISIAQLRSIPIPTPSEYNKIVSQYTEIIDKIAEIYFIKKNTATVRKLIKDHNIDKHTVLTLFNEAEKRAANKPKEPIWKILLKIILFLLRL